MIPSCFEAFGLYATLERFFPFLQVKRPITYKCEILWGMVFSHLVMVFAKRCIQAPMQIVYDDQCFLMDLPIIGV